MNKKSTDISKFLSYILRHQPESIGLSLDKEGWAVINDLILCAAEEGYTLDNNIIHSIVNNSNKKRFTISDDGLRIRADQGHSSQQVDIKYEEKKPPECLYHGTATRFVISIRTQGLNAKERQYVHLSANEETAIQVGSRHGKPMVLKVKALTMYEQGFKFYQADNGVWLTEQVPYQFIQE
ncbi:RNA 2'-phosphotransferase [Pectobacterium colocasium]|uniref:RNA 2'-phosphotransferase n=1 Tax=Pectobacterium colocasium TaxID=2878098 RepID=UPI001CD75018|nr:RNA 2'-phosphotransferase [Pectobacterium colocasium]